MCLIGGRFWDQVLSQTVSGVKNVTNQTCGAACLGLQPLVNKKVAESNVFIKLKVSQSPLYTYNYCTHRVFGSWFAGGMCFISLATNNMTGVAG